MNVTPDTAPAVCVDTALNLSAVPSDGTPPYFYEWTEDGVALTDGPDVSGSGTANLSISRSGAVSHDYNCRVSDSSGSCVDLRDATDTVGNWTVCATAAPPLGNAHFDRGPGDAIQVSYDNVTCNADHAIAVWGHLGDWSGYAGDVGQGCDLGNSGSGDFTFPGTNVWFNLLWVNVQDSAGHPGSGTPQPRNWNASGMCSAASDDLTDPVCD